LYIKLTWEEFGQISVVNKIEDEGVEIMLDNKMGSENNKINENKVKVLVIKSIEVFALNENCSFEAIEAI